VRNPTALVQADPHLPTNTLYSYFTLYTPRPALSDISISYYYRPRYVFGTGGITTAAPIHHALSVGYRAFDTAQLYRNEASIGESIRAYPLISQIPRSELFIISKIEKPGKDIQETYEGIVKSVEDIGLGGYIDLMLIHNPNYGPEGREIQWGALEKAKAEGLVRAIGVSNL
jgi:diketogulonate reductase-like aldo/keto reductase